MKEIFDIVLLRCVVKYEEKEDSLDLMSELEEDRYAEYLPKAHHLGQMVGSIVELSNAKMEDSAVQVEDRPLDRLVAKEPALIGHLKSATKDFDVSKSISTIFSHPQVPISCLKEGSLGLRSTQMLVEVKKEGYERETRGFIPRKERGSKPSKPPE